MKFRLGINYWPAGSAMYWWRRFDRRAVERDFGLIRAAGFDSLRLFLLWEDFQPEPGTVEQGSLEKLLAVAETAADRDLALVCTLFTGHMSGANWLPRWALQPSPRPGRFRVISGRRAVEAEPRNWYADPAVQGAQALLAAEVAGTLRDHPAVWAWDLGNENSNVCVPPVREAGVAWLERMSGAIREAGADQPITIGLHQEDLEEDRFLGPAEAATSCDFLCMHGYPVYARWSRRDDDDLILPFLGLLTRWLGGREVLFEEFGAPTLSPDGVEAQAGGRLLFAEEEARAFTRRALSGLYRFGFTGAMLWCFADYDRSLWGSPPLDEAPHERFFGLWREGRPKPAVSEIARYRGLDVAPPPPLDWIDIPSSAYYRDPAGNLRRLYARFVERFA